MFYIIDCRFTENEMYAKTNKWQIQKLMHFDSHFITNSRVISHRAKKTTKKYRVMIEEPVNYKYMYVFSPGDSIACIMKDAVCKFYKEKFQIKKYRESALATYSILLFWNFDKNFDSCWTKKISQNFYIWSVWNKPFFNCVFHMVL